MTRRTIASVFVACMMSLYASVVGAQAEFDAAIADMNRIVAQTNAFISKVRFDEGDVEKLISLWDDYERYQNDAAGEEDAEYDWDEEDDSDLDFDAALADPEYRSWAASHGLDAEDFMRKSTRISMMLMADMMQQMAAQMMQQLPQQRAGIEAQKNEINPEHYQLMIQGIEEQKGYAKGLTESWGKLDKPTAAEQRALDAYRNELMVILSQDDDDEDDYYGEEYYDEDYDEEYAGEDW